MLSALRKLSRASVAHGLLRMNARVLYAAILGEFSLYGTLYFAPNNLVADTQFRLLFLGTVYVCLICAWLRIRGPHFITKPWGIFTFRALFITHAALYAACCGFSIRLLLLKLPLGIYNISATSVLLWGSSVAVTTFAFDFWACLAYVACTLAPVMICAYFEVQGAAEISATYGFSLMFFAYLGRSIHGAEVEALRQEELIKKQSQDLLGANAALMGSNQLYADTVESVEEIFYSLDLEGICIGSPTARGSEILGRDPRGASFTELLGLDGEAASDAESWLKLLSLDRLDFEEVAERGPKQWQSGQQRSYHIRYFAKRAQSKELIGVIMTLTDVTEKLRNEKDAQDARQRAEFILSVSGNPEAFNQFLKELMTVFAELAREGVREHARLRAQLHTFKGTASVFSAVPLAIGIHALETELKTAEQSPTPDFSFCQDFARRFLHDLEQWRGREEATLLKLGVFAQPEIRLKVNHLDKVNALFHGAFPERELKRYLRALNGKNLRAELEKFAEPVAKTAAALDKRVELEITSADVLLAADAYTPVFQAMIHLFNNAVDHGLEDAETRMRKGKPAVGKIQIRATCDKQNLHLEVQDDGAGIDPQNLRQALARKGVDASGWPDAKVLRSVFDLGFSTREQATRISGQGVGLYALYEAIKHASGELNVRSEPERGTTFAITLPVENESVFPILNERANAA